MMSSVRDSRCRRLIDQAPGTEPVECERSGDWMRLSLGNCSGKHMTGAGCRLETAGAPAAIDLETRNWCRTNDRRTIIRGVDDAAPVA